VIPALVPPAVERSLDDVLAAIAAGAAERDRDPGGAFPFDAILALADAGATQATAGPAPIAYADELVLLRAVARADMGVARILDGHLNAVERLRVHAPPELRDEELAAIAAGARSAGVWGADPVPGEGEPARIAGAALWGTKTFCSGAGGLHRALVLARTDDAGAPPVAAWVDLTATETVDVDRTWFRGSGMRSSASHRVTFSGTPVIAVLGPPGALLAQPWFARDAVRTAATWVGAADAAVEDALDHLAARPRTGDLEALAAGRLRTWQETMGLWLGAAAEALDAGGADARRAGEVAAPARTAIADSARAILDEAERATGSRPAAIGATLDRAARDLRLFLLQHRLEPILARTGAAELEDRR
jgi:alkylation response protein AidB-like acyl-CoA dehydrogenase